MTSDRKPKTFDRLPLIKTVPEIFSNQRVDIIIAKLFPDYSRSMLSRWLKDGLILIDDKTLKAKEKLSGGEKITFNVPLDTINVYDKAQNIPLDIIFEDEDLLIINKSANLIVHPGAGNPDNTLVNALLYHNKSLQNLPRAGIVHRLDKDTTGLLVVAKNLKSFNHLIESMQNREIKRCYKALVHGRMISGARLETYFGRHARNRLKMSVLKGGKVAISEYRINKIFANFTLLDVSLVTGRTHQIRVHMEHINHPIVGDQLYCARAKIPANTFSSIRSALNSFKRQALHAGFLELTHPTTKQIMQFKAPLPKDYQSLLDTIDFNKKVE